MINYLNKFMVTICCAIASMCADAKGAEENDVNNVAQFRTKILNIQQDTNTSLSIAIDQLIYSPLQHTKTLVTSFSKFAYENPAMAAITATYFMLPVVEAYANTAGSYWSPQYCCAEDVSSGPVISTTKCLNAPSITRYTSGFPGFSDQASCMYDAQYNHQFENMYIPTIASCYTDPACTQSGDCSYQLAFVNNNTYGTPFQASCVLHHKNPML